MKLSEVRPCDSCGKKITPNFYIIRASLAFFVPTATNEVLGLSRIFGGALSLAEAMAPEPDVIKIAGDETPDLMNEIILCQECYMIDNNLSMLVENLPRKREVNDD